MKSAIEDIYDGNAGADAIPTSEKYRKLLSKIADKSDEIIKTLSKKQKELFDEIVHISCGLEGESSLSGFKYGFELG